MLILTAIGWLAVWSNHFRSGFHFDDIPTIVDNESVHHVSSAPRFFVNPRISSAEKDSASYRPLLSTWLALDYWMGNGNPFTFQLANWLWFAATVLLIFLLFRVIPGVENFGAGFAALLFGVHPVTADTVNYAVQQGTIMGAFGVTAGLVIFAYWPWRMPQQLPLTLKRVPEHGLDEFLRRNFRRIEETYLKIIHASSGLYLWPVVPALLCDPSTAVFAPILVVYILLFETKRTLRNAVPAAVICGGYWVFQLFFTLRLGEYRRMPAVNYWFTQPWVALRYLAKFFVPARLSVDSDLPAFDHLWDPLAIAGYAGVAVLIAAAILTARRSELRAVSFGIWWFLIALVPDALVPQRVVEADWRMFLPFIGLALAVARVASAAVQSLPEGSIEQRGRLIPVSAMSVLAFAILGAFGWGTYQRSEVWASDASLWRNASQESPGNGRALMRYGLTQISSADPGAAAEAFDYIRRASVVSPHDPLIAINLAKALGRRGDTSGAEKEFRRAVADGSGWSPAYSAYADWLLAQTRSSEARDNAKKALALDSYDTLARRTMMDVMAQEHQWDKLKQFADDTLNSIPDDPDGRRSEEVAQTGLDHIEKSEKKAKYEPDVDNYLALSVEYYQTERYEDCINAAKKALEVNPKQAEAYANLATAYHTLGRLDEALAALQEEVKLNPDLPNAKSNLEVVQAEIAKKQGGKAATPTSTSAPSK